MATSRWYLTGLLAPEGDERSGVEDEADKLEQADDRRGQDEGGENTR